MQASALLLLLLSAGSASAWNCTGWSPVEQNATGGFCTDHDQGHVVPAGADVVAFAEATCSLSRAFFFGQDGNTTYVWCADSCASGCGTDMPQCKALYMRECDGAPPAPPGHIGGLVLVPQGPRGAACLDGSAPGYWMDKAGAAENSSRWVIHAQGGGWCWNEAECTLRAKGALGSSKGWVRENGHHWHRLALPFLSCCHCLIYGDCSRPEATAFDSTTSRRRGGGRQEAGGQEGGRQEGRRAGGREAEGQEGGRLKGAPFWPGPALDSLLRPLRWHPIKELHGEP